MYCSSQKNMIPTDSIPSSKSSTIDVLSRNPTQFKQNAWSRVQLLLQSKGDVKFVLLCQNYCCKRFLPFNPDTPTKAHLEFFFLRWKVSTETTISGRPSSCDTSKCSSCPVLQFKTKIKSIESRDRTHRSTQDDQLCQGLG